MKHYLAVSLVCWFAVPVALLGLFCLVLGPLAGSEAGPLIALGVFMLVPSMILVATGTLRARARLRVLQTGTRAPGVVVEDPQLRNDPGFGSMPSLVYQFHPSPGVTYDGAARMTTGTWNRFAAGDPITVAYDPLDPRKNEPDIFRR